MLIIRGDQRVADIYFTEFNRLFFHYYFRSVQEATLKPGVTPKPGSAGDLFLSENDDWLGKSQAGIAAAKTGRRAGADEGRLSRRAATRPLPPAMSRGDLQVSEIGPTIGS